MKRIFFNSSFPRRRESRRRRVCGERLFRAIARDWIPVFAGMTLICFISAPALAHPHVFINNTTGFVFKDNKVAGIRLYWVFDPIFSAEVIRSYDANKDKQFDAKESAVIAETILQNLKDFHYLSYITVSGEKLPAIRPTEFKATMQGDRVAFALYMPLPQPIDPHAHDIGVSVYDQSYYIEVTLSKDIPVLFEPEAKKTSCSFKKFTETDPQYFGGMITFERVKLVCT
jgi:ABC-type uncharacterized transport system substrate-binding protein